MPIQRVAECPYCCSAIREPEPKCWNCGRDYDWRGHGLRELIEECVEQAFVKHPELRPDRGFTAADLKFLAGYKLSLDA